MVQQVPRGYGFEARRQLCRKFETHLPVRSRGVLQSPLVVDEISRAKTVDPSVEKQNKAVDRTDDEGSCSPGSGRVSPSKTGVCGVWKHEPHRPGAVGQKKR